MSDYVDMHALRSNYLAVTAWMVECGEWTDAEADEIGAAIKQAVDQAEAGWLAWWAEWLARWAALVAAESAYREALYQRALADARRRCGLEAGV